MLEKSDGLLFYELIDHIAKYGANCIEPLVCLADIGQADIVQQDLLDNENCHSFTQFGSSFHYAKAERDNLSGKEEIDHFRGIVLHQCSNDPQRGEAEIFERAGLRRSVEERI